MDKGTLCIALLGIIPMMLWLFLCWLCSEHSTYRKHSFNPYIRHCEKCGQAQSNFCWSMEDWNRAGWWEAMGEIENIDCPCHKDCPDYEKVRRLHRGG